MISLFADNKKSDTVVGIDVVKIVDIRRDKLEYEHDIVTSVQILF